MKREQIHIRDPFVIRENGKYYLLGTTGDDPWGKASDLTLYCSDDLENFERVCVMVDPKYLETYTNIWAPEMHKYKGRFYLIVSVFRDDLGRGSMIFVSDKLDDSFVPLTGEYITPKGWGCLDSTLFVYQNKPYLCFSNEWMTPITNDGDGALFIAEISEDLTHLVEQPHKIISGKYSGIAVSICVGTHHGYVAEGPWLYSEGDDIVLLWSTASKTGYTVVRSVSHTGIYGEYQFDSLVFEKDGGHCMRFLDGDGTPWITIHAPNSTPNERMMLWKDEERL